MGRYTAGRERRVSSSSPDSPSTSFPNTRATPAEPGPVAGGKVASAMGVDPSLSRFDTKYALPSAGSVVSSKDRLQDAFYGCC